MIPLVEVMCTVWTDKQVADTMRNLLADAGKPPVMVNKDVPGFIGNRLQHALWRKAVSLAESDIYDAEAVDTVIKSSFGSRLAVLGPLENAEPVGTDLPLDTHKKRAARSGEPSRAITLPAEACPGGAAWHEVGRGISSLEPATG